MNRPAASSEPGTSGHPPPGAATIVALHLCPGPRSRSVLWRVERVTAIADRGLEGDRNARPGSDRQVLLVEQEVLEALDLEPGAIREQVTVRGLGLGALAAGTRLRAGTAVLAIEQVCDPCRRMNEVRPGLMELLEGRRGRFARVVEAGAFAVGDALVVEAGAP